jgi:hypothetical protein
MRMAEAAWEAPGVIGARMTGAGFGGCTVNLVQPDMVDAFTDAVGRRYAGSTGRARHVPQGCQCRWCTGDNAVIEPALGALLDYGQAQGLIVARDRVYVRNRILEVLRIDDYDLAAEGPRTLRRRSMSSLRRCSTTRPPED